MTDLFPVGAMDRALAEEGYGLVSITYPDLSRERLEVVE
jgi:hypothetical protein